MPACISPNCLPNRRLLNSNNPGMIYKYRLCNISTYITYIILFLPSLLKGDIESARMASPV